MDKLIKKWLIPVFIMGSHLTLVPMVYLLAIHFNWITLCFTFLQLLFPYYSIRNHLKKRVETPARLRSFLTVLLISIVAVSIAALGQIDSLRYPLAITWLHFILVVLATLYLPKLNLQDTILKVGKRLPEFVFDDVNGDPVTRTNIGEGPILFYFFRGNWCPFCSAQINELMNNYHKIRQEGINLAFVSTQPHDETKSLSEKFGLDVSYLVDRNFNFSSKYALIDHQGVPVGMSKFGKDTLLPTLMLIDHRNKILLLEQTDNFRFRPDPEVILDKVQKLGANAYLEKVIEQRTYELNLEKEKADKIILNILPEHTAIELKEKGKTQARYYEMATLLFSDFVGFTKISSGVEPQLLVDSLNAYFERYDQAVESIGLEKIKTIGDAYMVAAGLPTRDDEHAAKCCEFAIKMLEIGNELKKKNHNSSLCNFACRIGIHSGPVMAGVVGKKKFCYDIWGDTVNLAARMESNSEPGKINISQSTLELLGDRANVIPRGKIEIKNHSPQEMYFLQGLKK